MEKIFTPTGNAREKVREEYMKMKEQGAGPYGYADTDSISSYSTGDGFHLSAVGPSFQMDLGKLSREEFWKMVDFICKMKGWFEDEDGEDW